MLIDFIDTHKADYGIEPICRVLAEHGIKIAPSTYYEARSRRPSRRERRDAEIVAVIAAERSRQRLLARFGSRKMWLHLRRQGHDVARCTVERLYRQQQGWEGALRLKKVRTTIADPAAERPLDRVDRQFWAARPNQLRVADFTYVATWSGTVYVAFIFDVFSRRIVGWRAATRMTTDLVLDTLEHAIWTRQQAGITDLSGGWSTTPMPGRSTSASPSPKGSSTRASTRPSGRLAMPTTTRSLSLRSGSTRPS